MKKAQIQTQVFIFILILLVVSLTIVFGYRYIRGLTKQGEEVSVTLFQQELEKKVKSISQNYGEVDIFELDLPLKYDIVCFTDADKEEVLANSLIDDYPLIKSSVEAETGENVFLGKKADVSFKVANLEIEDGFLCVNNTYGKIKLRVEGLGNKAKIIRE